MGICLSLSYLTTHVLVDITILYSWTLISYYLICFDKLIWYTIGPKLLIWHYTVLSLGQMPQLIMIILSLIALTLLIASRYIPIGPQTKHCWAYMYLAHASNIFFLNSNLTLDVLWTFFCSYLTLHICTCGHFLVFPY